MRAVISDIRQASISANSVSFATDVRSFTDYYAFGGEIAGRKFNTSDYRFGFNGKENDPETGFQDYGMRGYNPQLCRFFRVDPIASQYPELTPYQFASNTPIYAIDLDGQEMELFFVAAREGMFGITMQKIANGGEDAGKEFVNDTYNFVTRDAWDKDTWLATGQILYEVGIKTGLPNASEMGITPLVDQVYNKTVDDFNSQVINGDAYTRSKYVTRVGIEVGVGVLTDKGVGAAVSAVKGTKVAATVGKIVNTVDPAGLARLRSYNFTRGYKPKVILGEYIPTGPGGIAPDFRNSKFLYKAGKIDANVEIKLTGKRNGTGGDFEAADAAMREKLGNPDWKRPDNYTWHHLDDFDPATGRSSMQLIETPVHQQTLPHTGSVRQYEVYNDATYK